MTLNDLLKGRGIDPAEVGVMRHTPKQPALQRVLPWLATEHPDVFNAYQQTQNEPEERALQKVKFVASLIGLSRDEAVFVGLYAVNSYVPTTKAECDQRPEVAALYTHGMTADAGGRSTFLWFDLTPVAGFYPHWKGRLVINWPPGRSFYRRAHNTDEMAVLAIHEESAFDPPPPPWNEMVLPWHELAVLPSRLRAKLGEWRGIYYIFDTASNKGYVGSASGSDNLLGRWREYAATGHGDNVHLKQCDPKALRFSVLELVSPALPSEEVIGIETTWKKRLHTRHPGGLNEN